MPGDTLVITNTGDTITLPDSAQHQHMAVLPAQTNEDNETTFSSGILVFAAIIVLPFLIARLWRKYQQRLAYQAAETSLKANYRQYDDVLANNNGYYKSLPVAMRARFLERLARFTVSKSIQCVDIAFDPKMPLLIGAASVQITFGLDKYLLDFFDTIYIMRQQYMHVTSQVPFQGHVNSNGIYLSWDNFLRGYEDYTDADNVGIHEMAHALAYVNFMADANDGQDENFIKRFYNFSTVARPIFNDMQNGTTNLLNPYAATNYNEFWAVSVETFFEKPLQMKIDMPNLYSSLCALLNQDPLSPEKVLSPV